MFSYLSIEDKSSPQPKIHVTTKTWELKISLVSEMYKTRQLLHDHIGCFTFTLKELGQLKR
jgi:hypothetical protein